MKELGRKPPRHVLEALRSEVGFCCPVDNCGSPYLTWHHFDPPWRYEKHHRVEGMIALCREHADKADSGSFTDDQLRELKRVGRDRAAMVRGRFDWMRRDLLAVVGGNFYYRQAVLFQIGREKSIWFERDADGSLLLNVRLPTMSTRPRARIENNVWSVLPRVAEVICPPHGRLVDIRYENGDRFKAEFFSANTASDLAARYPRRGVEGWSSEIEFPVTVVEIQETAAGTTIQFGASETSLLGHGIRDCFFANSGGVALHIDAPDEIVARLFPPDDDMGSDSGEAIA